MNNFSENCDWLREKFSLPVTTSIYELIDVVTIYIKNQKLEKSSTEEISKEKKDVRKRRSNSN